MREGMEASGRDRYDALLRHLQAGKEIQVQQRKRSYRLDIHPSARKIVIAAVVVVIVWFGAIAVTDWFRYGRTDTWAGPAGSTVTSGLRLAGCPEVVFRENVYFPAWVRVDDRVYRWTDRISPIGPNSIGDIYLETGYTLGDLEIFRFTDTASADAGSQLMIRQGDSPVGALFVATNCT